MDGANRTIATGWSTFGWAAETSELSTDAESLSTQPEEYAELGLGPLPPGAPAVDLYLDMVKRAVANILYEDVPFFFDGAGDEEPVIANAFSLQRRVMGEDTPSAAHTMIGVRRLEN